MDLNVSYGGVKNLLLSVGARNVFDKQPAIFVPTSNQFQSGYDVAQYDPRGRFVYAKATYLFR
jgi:iron complex outermembrane receptor protein